MKEINKKENENGQEVTTKRKGRKQERKVQEKKRAKDNSFLCYFILKKVNFALIQSNPSSPLENKKKKKRKKRKEQTKGLDDLIDYNTFSRKIKFSDGRRIKEQKK